ncbi:hypothetical protein TKY121527_03780 [Streptococcus pneumoniae]|nr:hypothetical protein PC0062_18360 [Streptococcus pneumoniae]BEL34646.1 hypothetical protein TKY121527_03780 [Streptococcus pneumoniae]
MRCLKEINSIKYFPEAKKTKIIDWDFADTCWEKDPRKYQYVAANYLKAMQSYLKETDLPKLEQLVVTKSLWDTVDILDRVVGSLVYEHPELEEIILILFENLFKPRQLYLQPQNSVLSNLRLAS